MIGIQNLKTFLAIEHWIFRFICHLVLEVWNFFSSTHYMGSMACMSWMPSLYQSHRIRELKANTPVFLCWRKKGCIDAH
jgi:hypothetical protein